MSKIKTTSEEDLKKIDDRISKENKVKPKVKLGKILSVIGNRKNKNLL